MRAQPTVHGRGYSCDCGVRWCGTASRCCRTRNMTETQSGARVNRPWTSNTRRVLDRPQTSNTGSERPVGLMQYVNQLTEYHK